MKSEVGEDYTEVTFNPSVKMSTYLVCFVISDFRNISHEITSLDVKNNFMLNVYAQPQQIEKVEFALDVGKSIIEYYIKYFGIEYPLPKLGKYSWDMVSFCFGFFFSISFYR